MKKRSVDVCSLFASMNGIQIIANPTFIIAALSVALMGVWTDVNTQMRLSHESHTPLHLIATGFVLGVISCVIGSLIIPSM